MYKYQCSKQDCGSTWTLQEGNLNGFALTCPICGKGRGLFISQNKNQIDRTKDERIEEIVITVRANSVKSVEDLNDKIEEFRKKYSLTIIGKDIQSNVNEVVCKILYKISN